LLSSGQTEIYSDDELQSKLLRARRDSTLQADTVGYYLDVQTARLQELARQGVTVSRAQDRIVVVIPGSASFDTGSSRLTPDVRRLLNGLAGVLREYTSTLVEVGGHSDSQGDPGFNQSLSQWRAASVGRYLAQQNIRKNRIVTRGFGDTRPVADNATESGRAQNRRIELVLWPLVATQAQGG